MSILSVMLCIGLGVGVVILRAQRRAEWREAQSGRSDDGGRDGGGFHTSAPQPFQPPAPNPPARPQPQAQPQVQPGPTFTPNPPDPQLLKPGLRQTPPAGGFFASKEYREYREDGALLTGFEVGYGQVNNTTVIAYLRPIWRTAQGEVYGTAYGRSQTPTAVVKARDGYAVGGIVIAGGGALEGFALTFMRIGAKHLDPDDAYTSEWYGERTRKPDPDGMRTGDGEFVVGIYGKRFEDKGGRNFDNAGGICTIGLTLWVKE